MSCWFTWWGNIVTITDFHPHLLHPFSISFNHLDGGQSQRNPKYSGSGINNRYNKTPFSQTGPSLIPNPSTRGGNKCQDLVRKSGRRNQEKKCWGGSSRKGSVVWQPHPHSHPVELDLGREWKNSSRWTPRSKETISCSTRKASELHPLPWCEQPYPEFHGLKQYWKQPTFPLSPRKGQNSAEQKGLTGICNS